MRRPWYRSYYPGWTHWGGGGGGSGTVQTDGVTIQGDGSAGNKIALLAVQTAARLTGAGTVASPLDLAAQPFNFFTQGTRVIGFGPAANTISLTAFVLPYAVTFAHLLWDIETADNANNSDLGLYNAAGTLIANIGAQHLGTTGFRSYATLQGSQTIQPGVYFAAITSAAAIIQPGLSQAMFTLYYAQTFGASAGGALPNSITPPAYSPSSNGLVFGMFT